MTTPHIDKLRRIDALLANLLSTAEKRTPGAWAASDNVCTADAVEGGYFITCDSMKTSMSTDANNAAFIAACAGNAEAGWKATRAAIAGYLKAETDDSWAVSLVASEVLESILSAFPNV